jgi:hypothetical protein
MAAQSSVRLWRSASDYLTLEYAAVMPRYSAQGERLVDRLGRVHRIAPGTPRQPTSLTLALIPEELTRLNNAGASPRQHAIAWLEQAFCQQERLELFVLGQSISHGNSAIARLLCYQGYIDELPGMGFGTLPSVMSADEQLELVLTIMADGAFSDFERLNSAEYTART